MKKLLLSIMAIAAVSFAQEAQQAQNPQPPKPGRPAAMNPQMLIGRLQKAWNSVLAEYDTNKNGLLDAEERTIAERDLDIEKLQKKLNQARAYELFTMVDEDKDGRLSEAELANMPSKLQAYVAKHGMGGMGGMGGRGGRGGMGGMPPRGEKGQRPGMPPAPPAGPAPDAPATEPPPPPPAPEAAAEAK